MSITIIDNTVEYSPILEYIPKPTFKSEYEKEKYWDEEKKKCLEGIGEIPGTLYHKTMHQVIRHRVTGKLLHPTCRDVDLLIHQSIRDCIREGEANAIIKARGIGLSTDFGCLANYFMRFNPGSTSFLTSSEQKKIAGLFGDKVMVAHNNYDKDIRYAISKIADTQSNCYLKILVKHKNENKETIYSESEVFCKQTSEDDASAAGFEGKGAIFGGYDEIFLHKRKEKLVRSSTSCFIEQETQKVLGFLLMGGTCSETLSNEEVSALFELIDKIKNKGRFETMPARLTFIPAWYGQHMVNGHSNKEKAIEEWNRKCDEYEKDGDSASLRAYRMNNPMSLEDIFELASGNKFEDDVQEIIKVQTKKVRGESIPLMKCRLVNLGGEVQTSESKNPNVFILEHPKQGIEYILGIDGVATGTESGEKDGSNVAAVITKLHDPNGDSFSVPAVMTERPKTVESSYIHILSLARYYNKYGGLKWIDAEGSNSTVDFFSSFLQKEGMIKYAMHRKDLSGKGNININKLFQPRDKHMMDWQFKWANNFLRKYGNRIKMLPLLEDMLRTGNADILDAWLMCGIILGLDYDKPVKPKITFVPEKRRRIVNRNGYNVVEWV